MSLAGISIYVACFIWLVISVFKDFREARIQYVEDDHEQRLTNLELRSMAHDKAIEDLRIAIHDHSDEDDEYENVISW